MQMLKNTKFHAQRPSRVFQTQQKLENKQTNKTTCSRCCILTQTTTVL